LRPPMGLGANVQVCSTIDPPVRRPIGCVPVGVTATLGSVRRHDAALDGEPRLGALLRGDAPAAPSDISLRRRTQKNRRGWTAAVFEKVCWIGTSDLLDEAGLDGLDRDPDPLDGAVGQLDPDALKIRAEL